MVKLYREAKANLIEPILFGRLVNCLNVIQSMDSGTLADERLDALEEKVAAIKPNGHARHDTHGRRLR
jgi:hypothetical protein